MKKIFALMLSAALPIHGPMATARSMYMAASYWGFVLMSIHLGMHWGMIVGMFRRLLKGRELPNVSVWGLRRFLSGDHQWNRTCSQTIWRSHGK